MSRQLGRSQVATTLVLAVAVMAGTLPVSVGKKSESENLLRMKAGMCNFRLLDAKGVKPLAGATLSLASAEDGADTVRAVADKTGACSMDVAAGRYVLSVNRQHLAILETSGECKTRECRIIVPGKDMLVGGQRRVVEEDEGLLAWLLGGGSGMKAVVIGGTTVLVGVGGYFIYDANRGDGSGSRAQTVVLPRPTGGAGDSGPASQ